jgi:tricorn protease
MPSARLVLFSLPRPLENFVGERKIVLSLGTRVALLWLLASLLSASSAIAQTKLLRFPDIHGDQVVFTYAGDLWLACTSGGLATRLSAHPGVELFAKFSSDGKWIAFTRQYDGDEQVYIIPVAGGIPKQLTFYPARGP